MGAWRTAMARVPYPGGRDPQRGRNLDDRRAVPFRPSAVSERTGWELPRWGSGAVGGSGGGGLPVGLRAGRWELMTLAGRRSGLQDWGGCGWLTQLQGCGAGGVRAARVAAGRSVAPALADVSPLAVITPRYFASS